MYSTKTREWSEEDKGYKKQGVPTQEIDEENYQDEGKRKAWKDSYAAS